MIVTHGYSLTLNPRSVHYNLQHLFLALTSHAQTKLLSESFAQVAVTERDLTTIYTSANAVPVEANNHRALVRPFVVYTTTCCLAFYPLGYFPITSSTGNRK